MKDRNSDQATSCGSQNKAAAETATVNETPTAECGEEQAEDVLQHGVTQPVVRGLLPVTKF
jgi:hypothetical protein